MKTAEELGVILRKMYDNAPRKEQVTFIHLFGIKFAEEIKAEGIKAVVDISGIPSTYKTEVNKGVNLSKYVTKKSKLDS